MSYIKSRKGAPAGGLGSVSCLGTAAATVLTGFMLSHATEALAQTDTSAASSSSSTVTALPSITVQGVQTNPYQPTRLESSKFTQPIANMTQTVVVVPHQVIQDQQALTLTDAMKNVPGAGTFALGENGSTNMGDDIYVRGIDTSSSIYIDGIRDTSTVHRDLFNTDSVEVILGPSGSDFGRTAPSGSINMVSKQPTLTNSFDASLGIGSASYKRGTIDWNQQLGDTSAFRLNVMGMKSGVQGRDDVKNDRTGIAPEFAFGLGTPTRVYLDILHVHQTNIPDGGVPTIGMPGFKGVSGYEYLGGAPKVDSNNFYGTDLDHDDSTTDMVTLRVDHDFNDDTTLSNATRYARTKQNYFLGSFLFTPGTTRLVTPDTSDPSTWSAGRLANDKNYNDRVWTNQTNLNTTVHTGSVEHDISTGVEFTREMQDNYGETVTGTLPNVNLYAPDSSVPGVSVNNSGVNTYARTDTAAIYGFDTIKIAKKFEINGGVRLDHYRTVYDSTTNMHQEGNLFTWKAGVLYHLTDNGNVYFNYGVSQQPPGGSDFTLQAAGTTTRASNDQIGFQPEKAKTADLGTKWQFFDKQMLVSLDLFQTKIYNDVEENDDGTYSQFGEKRVQGVQLGVAGQITRQWSVNAGYIIQHAYIADGASVNADGSSGLGYTPEHAFTLWTTYQLPKGFRLGGGAIYQGHMLRQNDAANAPTPNETDDYWVFNAMAGYRVNSNLDLQLNVNNIFNKDYIASINKSGYRYYPGVSRNVMLTANIHFK